jgi:hypothetical protein
MRIARSEADHFMKWPASANGSTSAVVRGPNIEAVAATCRQTPLGAGPTTICAGCKHAFDLSEKAS